MFVILCLIKKLVELDRCWLVICVWMMKQLCFNFCGILKVLYRLIKVIQLVVQKTLSLQWKLLREVSLFVMMCDVVVD